MVNGNAVHWSELRPLMAEAAGGIVLEEIILDRMLSKRLTQQNITISDEDLARERRLLIETLDADQDVARRLLEELQARRGFGPKRLKLLLHRNAALRRLVSDEVTVTDKAVERLFEMRHGPKRQARLLTAPDLQSARRAIERIKSGEFFSDVAVELSTDSSASRGGLLEPISRADPSYPQALREALWTLKPGELSSPVLLDNKYAVMQLVRSVPADDTELKDVRSELQRLTRLNQQRIAMDQLARQLLNEASVTVFDESLRSGWSARNRRQIRQ